MAISMKEPRYLRKKITLKGDQPKVFDLPFPADFIAFIDTSEVNPDYVYVAFNEPHVFIPISKSATAELREPIVKRLLFKWETSEEGKTIEIYCAGAPSVIIRTTTIAIGADLVGLAKESTLSEIKTRVDKLQFDSDNDLYVVSRAVEGSPIDYTTTDTLSDVATLDISPYDKVTIMIKNTGSNSADIEVYTKANATGTIEYLEYSDTLSAGDVAKIQLNGRYAQAIIRAKSTTAGASTTLRIEWIGGK